MPVENLINTRVVLALTGYCIFAGILVVWKPSFIYDKDQNNFRKFGVGRSETLFSLEVVLVLTAIVAYAISCLFSSGSIIEGLNFGTSNSESSVPILTPEPGIQQVGGGGGGNYLQKHILNDSLYPSVATTSFFHQPTQPYFHKPSISFPPSKIWKSSSFSS